MEKIKDTDEWKAKDDYDKERITCVKRKNKRVKRSLRKETGRALSRSTDRAEERYRPRDSK
jgi:hypothetical protein